MGGATRTAGDGGGRDGPGPAANGHAPRASSDTDDDVAAAAAAGDAAGAPLIRGVLPRDDVVRVIIQALGDLGCGKAAHQLVRESGVAMESGDVVELRRRVLAGEWADVEELLPRIPTGGAAKRNAVLFELRAQHFLELLEAGRAVDALRVLRTGLSPLGGHSERLHHLSSLVMCTEPAVLRERAQWRGTGVESRKATLQRVQALLPAGVMVPNERLFTLLEQAVRWQRSEALQLNAHVRAHSLLHDINDSAANLPQRAAHVLKAHHDEVWFVQFAHSGRLLATAAKDGELIVWRVSTGTSDGDPDVTLHFRCAAHAKAICKLAWAPDDSALLTCSSDRTIKLWSAGDGSLVHTYRGHKDPVATVVWLPDGRSFISGGLGRTLRWWNVRHRSDSNSGGGSDGESDDDDDDDDGADDVRAEWGHYRVCDLAVSGDGGTLFVVGYDKRIRVIDLADVEAKPRVFEERDSITSISMAQDGRHLLVNISAQVRGSVERGREGEKEIHLWDTHTMRQVQTYIGQKQGRYVIRSGFGGVDETFVVSGSEDSRVYIWNRHKGVLVRVLSGHTGSVNSVSWNPALPGMLASASDDRTVIVWLPDDTGGEQLEQMTQ